MAGFPLFWDGVLLFCDGNLASTCCSVDEDSPWNPQSWESHGQEFHDPPCSAPTEWDGVWGIYGNCFIGQCGGQPRPKVSLNVTNGNRCSCYTSVLTDWMLGRVTFQMKTAPFSGVGVWTVYLGGSTLTTQVEFTKGIDVIASMDVPDGLCDDLFSESGICEIRSRFTVRFPSGNWKDKDDTVYVWKEDYSGIRATGKYAICPLLTASFVEGYGPHIYYEYDGINIYGLYVGHLVGAYSTLERAKEVVGGYETEISDYAEKCACDYECVGGDPICTSGEIPANWDGKWRPGFAGCETEPGGCDYASTYVTNWSVDCSGSGYTFSLQLKNPITGEWETIASVEAPGEVETGPFIMPPCAKARAYLLAESASGEYSFGGDYYYEGTNDDCTSEIEAAFATVPLY